MSITKVLEEGLRFLVASYVLSPFIYIFLVFAGFLG